MLLCLMISRIIAKQDLLLITVATEDGDPFKRYLRSAQVNGLKGKVVGMGEEWLGGDMDHPGGGFKINLLKKEVGNLLKNSEDPDNLIVMFTDSYDVLLLENNDEILKKFKEFNAKVVFGAEPFCWPDQQLEDQYPEVKDAGEKRFLNSGGFIGYISQINKILNQEEIKDTDDDQLYYTKIYLDTALRSELEIKLDTKSVIFHNLNGATDEVELKFQNGHPYLTNIVFDTRPSVLHGNGPPRIKLILNSYGNYLPKAWNFEDQCTSCQEDTIRESSEIPMVVLGETNPNI